MPTRDEVIMKSLKETFEAGVSAERNRILRGIQAMIKPGSTKVYCFCNWTYVKPEDVLMVVEGKK